MDRRYGSNIVLHTEQQNIIIVLIGERYIMNRDILKQIMIDQKEIYLNNPLLHRLYPLEEGINYCFVGIRRTGKSYMMYQQIKQLEIDGVPLSQIVYVNFETGNRIRNIWC